MNEYEKNFYAFGNDVNDVDKEIQSELNKHGWSHTTKLSQDTGTNVQNKDAVSYFQGSDVKAATPKAIVVKKVIDVSVKKLKEMKNSKKQKENQTEMKNEKANVGSSILALLGGGFLTLVTTIIQLITTSIAAILIPICSVIAIVGFIISSTQYSTITDIAKVELEVSEENIGGQKYKDWYGINDNWCAMFVSYCANELDYIDDDIMPKTASVANMADWYKDRGLWKNKDEYTPKAGDIIFFQNGMSHVGIVIDYDENKKIITTIEGNTGHVDTETEHEHDFTTAQDCDGCNTREGNVYYTNNISYTSTNCSTCGGDGLITCNSCTSGIINCTTCGGDGLKKCTNKNCSDGFVKCTTCYDNENYHITTGQGYYLTDLQYVSNSTFLSPCRKCGATSAHTHIKRVGCTSCDGKGYRYYYAQGDYSDTGKSGVVYDNLYQFFSKAAKPNEGKNSGLDVGGVGKNYGKKTCTTCSGDGLITCNSCSSGNKNCSTCGGDGLKKCTGKCNGTGKWGKCEQCNGQGINYKCQYANCKQNYNERFDNWKTESNYNSVCYITSIEYHEGSRVQKKEYPLTYAKITGYGLPEYPWWANLKLSMQ